MTPFIEDISQISIYLIDEKDVTKKVNEVALNQPFASAEMSSFWLHRKWSFASDLSFSKKLLVKIEAFFFQKFPFFIKEERKNIEAKFKTVLAILLSQKELYDFFLKDEEKQKNFFEAIKLAAKKIGYKDFALPPLHFTPLQMGQFLTTISQQRISLLENLEEFNWQLTILDKNERDEILFHILNHIDRPPVKSVVEAHNGESTEKRIHTTIYGKYKVLGIDEQNQKVRFNYEENRSIPYMGIGFGLGAMNHEEKVVINQHKVLDTTIEENKLLIGVSGELLHHYRVLAQILFLLQVKGECFVEKYPPIEVSEKVIYFTSLFSWNEYDKIIDEHFAIEKWHGKTLKIVNERGEISYVRLSLHHQNVPFNAFNKFPSPSEIKGALNDINDKALIFLSDKILDFFPLNELARKFEAIRHGIDFMRKENDLLECVDTFRQMKKDLIDFIDASHPACELIALKTLLSKKLPNGKALYAIDMFYYLSLLIENLSFYHNVNCVNAIDRSAGAISLIKAQNAYKYMVKTPYLPGFSQEEEIALFRIFYSLYLVFEEPEFNAALTTGFIGEKYYNNILQKNPETTYYLIPCLKQYPEMYLGLSNYRK